MVQGLKETEPNYRKLEKIYVRLWKFFGIFTVISVAIIALCILLPFEITAKLLEDFVLPTFIISFILSVVALFYVAIKMHIIVCNSDDAGNQVIIAQSISEINNLKANKPKYTDKDISDALTNMAQHKDEFGYSTNTSLAMHSMDITKSNYSDNHKIRTYDSCFGCGNHVNSWNNSSANPCGSRGYMGYSSYSSYSYWNHN